MGASSSRHHAQPAQQPQSNAGGQFNSRFTSQIAGAAATQPSSFGQLPTTRQQGFSPQPPPRMEPPRDAAPQARNRQMLEEVPTIKNAVNLRPKTLQVLPRANAPHILDITFVFDATKPCTVTTHVAAMEILRTMELSTPQLPPPRIQFNAGLGQKFQDQTGRHCVNLSLYEEDALQAAQGAVYPLVVRLEVLADGSQGKSLDSLPPGAAQPEWVQSQTTFAELKKGEDGTWSAKVIKQKIWFDGTPYELQEIYGLQSSNDQGGGAADDDNSTECIICMTNDREVALLPCRHMCMCAECARIMMSPNNPSTSRAKCPICRRRVHNFLSIRKTGARGPENV